MQAQVEQWLKEGKVDIFIGYKNVDGHVIPHFFTKENIDEVKELVVGQAHYSLEKVATKFAAVHPDMKIGILLARDCNQQALDVLHVWNQLNPNDIQPMEAFDASSVPDQPKITTTSYKRQVGLEKSMLPKDVEAFDQAERFSRWMYEFSKCIKCYGCRDVCPVCFCKECSLEHKDLVQAGNLPPEIPIFHLVRAVHMAGRCIDCGLCEEACPAEIPLRLLYRKVDEIVQEVFDYETGTSPDQSPFSILGEKVTLKPTPINEASDL